MMGVRNPLDSKGYAPPWVEDRYEPLLPIWIIDLKFGAEPEEWELIWVFEFEAMARDFWELVEQNPTLMPCSWVD